MVAANAMRSGKRKQTRVFDLAFPEPGEETSFSRADLVFTGLDHSDMSYEVRVFLNNPDADATTERSAENRYAGRFHVLGHGGCYGDVGHCDIPDRSADPTDLRGDHALTPMDTYLTVTDALRSILATGKSLQTVTLVPMSVMPQRKDRKPAPELLRFDDVSLHTYVSEHDAPQPASTPEL